MRRTSLPSGAALKREAARVRMLIDPHGAAAAARAAPALALSLLADKAAAARIASGAREIASASLSRPSPASIGAPVAAVRGAAGSMRARLSAVREALCVGLLERETEARLLLLAAVCEDHLLLLGPPGVAKSELARRLAVLCAADGAGDSTAPAYFERQLHRHTLPEELFGPLSLSALQEDRIERKTAGFLPSASVAFLDEIFKASSATCNALLSLLHERTFEGGPYAY